MKVGYVVGAISLIFSLFFVVFVRMFDSFGACSETGNVISGFCESITFVGTFCSAIGISIILLSWFFNKEKNHVETMDELTVDILYIASFLIPLAGVLIGAYYVSRDDEHQKHVGKFCLIFGLISIFLTLVIFLSVVISS